MMRKQSAIFFIILANIILLAHAVVPHHHHERKVCINLSHCQPDSTDHQHDTANHDHQHNGESDAQACVLKQVVVIPSNHWEPSEKCVFGSDNPLSFLDFQVVLSDIGFKVHLTGIVSSAQSDLNITCNFNFFSSAQGLRAPPFV